MKKEYNPWDPLYEKAKEDGYRSRAAYKLLEIQKKYSIIKPKMSVLDMGCWPGGWTQVAISIIKKGLVVGVDLQETEKIEGAILLTGDLRDEEIIEKVKALSPAGYDALISDMSPKLTGIKEADEAGVSTCVTLAGYLSDLMLKKGASLVFKAFRSNDTELAIKEIKKNFTKLIRAELDSTRATSGEFYVVCLGKKH